MPLPHSLLIEVIRQVMNTMNKTYSELCQINDYYERFNYLQIGGMIGIATFGCDRYLNQIFYNSPEWKRFRKKIIFRDKGCDMAFDGVEVSGRIIVVHHLNPITVEDVLNRSYKLFDPENVVTVSDMTHKAIHYGDAELIQRIKPIERIPNDTCPWR